MSKIFFVSIIFILFFVLIHTADAYSISSVWQQSGLLNITEIQGSHVMDKDGNLASKLYILLTVAENFSLTHPSAILYFEPHEHMTNMPIQDVTIILCQNYNGFIGNYDSGYSGPCQETNLTRLNETYSREFIYEGKVINLNYSHYKLIFTPQNTVTSKYILLINYTLPNFTFKQGDYSVAWFNFPNMANNEIKMKYYVTLPSEQDVPRFIPETKRIERLPYYEKGKLLYRWCFFFEGANDQILWYWNEKEIKEKEAGLQSKYTKIGIGIGFVSALILLLIERLFFDWFPYGNRINRWFINKFNPSYVVGNVNGKKYHQIDCVYVDNITNKNRKQFRNKKDAEKEGYTACNLCK